MALHGVEGETINAWGALCAVSGEFLEEVTVQHSIKSTHHPQGQHNSVQAIIKGVLSALGGKY